MHNKLVFQSIQTCSTMRRFYKNRNSYYNIEHFYYFRSMDKKKRPLFNKCIFWDVNYEQLDYDAKSNFVIERVFERGDVKDIRQCRRYYGDEKVTSALLNAKYLPLHTIHFASAVIDKPLNEFRCYILRQLNPGLFPY
jgi:hypothetical protein